MNILYKQNTTSGLFHISDTWRAACVSRYLWWWVTALMGWSWTECCGSSTRSWLQPSSPLFCSFHTRTHRTEKNTPQAVSPGQTEIISCYSLSEVHLCYAYSGHPKVHGPSVVTAQVLDVLRLFLDLRMLSRQTRMVKYLDNTTLPFQHRTL